MLVIYALLMIALQSVVFARLSFFGVSPDLVLVSVISFAVLEKRNRATLFAAGSSFLQDILSFGIYMHTITRVVACSLVSTVKESFAGNGYSLTAGLVVFFTPLILIVEGGFYSLFGGRPIDIMQLLFTILVATFYNLFMVPVIFPIVKKLSHA